MGKVKIFIPFFELLNNMQYKEQIIKIIKESPVDQTLNINNQDSVNIQDDSPILLFSPHATEINEYVPPFYVSFNTHGMVLHN